MDALHFDIVGADAADLDQLVASISAAVGLAPDSKTSWSAHFTAGISTIGVSPAVEGFGPAQLYILGPASQDLIPVIDTALRRTGWSLRPETRAA